MGLLKEQFPRNQAVSSLGVAASRAGVFGSRAGVDAIGSAAPPTSREKKSGAAV